MKNSPAREALNRAVNRSIANGAPVYIEQTTQTKLRGTNSQEYEIYVSCAESLGWSVKTYDEWINS